jgi:hypothetical protein
MNEMKVQDLVFDKSGQLLHGFVNLGDVNQQLKMVESQVATNTPPNRNIATHILTIMIRGVFIKLEFPYANSLRKVC